MRFWLGVMLLDSKVLFITSWRWLDERFLSRKLINVCFNIIRWVLIVYIGFFFVGFYSFGWFF